MGQETQERAAMFSPVPARRESGRKLGPWRPIRLQRHVRACRVCERMLGFEDP